MKAPAKYFFLFAAMATVALSGCKKCKECFAYQGTDDSKGRPEYHKVGMEYCDDDLALKESASVPNSDSTGIVAQYQCESSR